MLGRGALAGLAGLGVDAVISPAIVPAYFLANGVLLITDAATEPAEFLRRQCRDLASYLPSWCPMRWGMEALAATAPAATAIRYGAREGV